MRKFQAVDDTGGICTVIRAPRPIPSVHKYLLMASQPADRHIPHLFAAAVSKAFKHGFSLGEAPAACDQILLRTLCRPTVSVLRDVISVETEFMVSEAPAAFDQILLIENTLPSVVCDGIYSVNQPVREANTRNECHWSHTWKHFKRSKGVKLNGIP